MTDKTGDQQSGMLLIGYGGEIQRIAPQATAVAQRDVVMKAVFRSIWYSEDEDPTLNTSGVPWSTHYYGDNYPRLQRVKARWDPRDVFHHALCIELPA
ncbi:BBE domain-containing protein [Streptacidiphilus melanogenes]|uniref:BBE domain-containing protein n=1 Tax=Streptacidiphilus melanogenes TaxID=411235 RepID=UPI000693AC8D|nr:BBE domain-containing protein [Streptacidiphilus melanogenes]